MNSYFASVEALESRRLLSAVALGGTGADAAYDVTTDFDGNTYIVGNFHGTVDFDPGPGVAQLSGGGTFIARFNSDGRFGWARRLPITSVPKIAADRGSVYAVGTFSGTVDFDPRKGVHNLTSAGGTDAFVLHLNGNGNFVFANRFGGNGNDEGTAIASDIDGKVVVGGQFSGAADFDPGANTFLIKSNGGTDGFIVYLNAAGGFAQAGSFGGLRNDSVADLALDNSGNVVATGTYFGTVDFDPDSKVTHTNTAITADAYVVKWTKNRVFAWIGGLGGLDNDHGISVVSDRDDNVYSTGTFIGQGDFNPAANGTFNLAGDANGAVYVSKLNADGTFAYAKQLPGTAAAAISVDKAKNVYAVGTFNGTGDFNPGAGTATLVSSGDDVFMAKLDASGNFVTANNLGDNAGGSVLKRNGNILIAGYFAGTDTFGSGGVVLTSNGDIDAFLAELTAGGAPA